MDATMKLPHHHTHPAIHHDASAAELAMKLAEERAQMEEVRLARRREWLLTLGRVLLAGLFITAGAVKLASYADTRSGLEAAGLLTAGFVLPLAIALELVGGLLLAVGFKARKLAVGLIVYLVGVTALLHGDLRVELNRSFALYNLAIAGGLLMLVGSGPGRHSADSWLANRLARRYGH